MWALAAAPVALATALFAGGAVLATPPSASPETRAEAIVSPSLVYLQTTYRGYVNGYLLNQPTVGGQWSHGDDQIFTAQGSCSGFVADPSGYVVTAGHCVDIKNEGRSALIKDVIARLVASGRLIPADQDQELGHALANWRVEGALAGSDPDRAVTVVPSVSSVPATTPMQAVVVDFKPFSDGDVALLKVQSSTPMPALEVAQATPDIGAQIVAAGFPGSVSEEVDPKRQPSFKTGTVSGVQTVEGAPFTEMSAAASPGMSGGPVVGLDGKVVGTVSWHPGTEAQSFNFMTDAGVIRSMLTSHGVATTLNPLDQAYRQGLDDYFAGKYHAAAAHFDTVLAQEPNHAQAQSYRAKAVASFPQEAVSPWLKWGGIGLLILAVAAGALLVVRRRTKLAGDRPAPSSAESAAAPEIPTQRVAGPATPVPAGSDGGPAGGDGAVSHLTYCPNCGHPHPAEAHFCAECGQPFATAVSDAGDSWSQR